MKGLSPRERAQLADALTAAIQTYAATAPFGREVWAAVGREHGWPIPRDPGLGMAAFAELAGRHDADCMHTIAETLGVHAYDLAIAVVERLDRTDDT